MIVTFKRKRNIFDVASTHREKLLAGEQATVQRMVRLYSSTGRAIRAKTQDIEKLIKDANKRGLEVNGDWLRRQSRYREIADQVSEELARFQAVAARETSDAVRQTAKLGAAQGASLIDTLRLDHGVVRLPTEAIEKIAGFAAPGSPLRDLFRDMGDGAMRQGESKLVEGIALGINPRVVGQQMADAIDSLSRGRAITIARNESIRAYTSVKQELYAANSDVIEGSMIVSAKDARTCLMCLGQDGKILAHGESYHRHVGCRCDLVPWTSLVEFPERESGADWFDSLSDEEQLAILGKGRADLYRQGVPLSALYEQTQDKVWGPGLSITPIAKVDKTAVRQPRVKPGKFISVSSKFSKSMVERAEQAAADIQAYHGVAAAKLPAIEAKPYVPRSQGEQGFFLGHGEDYQGFHGPVIAVSTRSVHAEITVMHEFAHYLDFERSVNLSGVVNSRLREFTMGDSRMGKDELDAIQGFLEAAASTDEIRRLSEALFTGMLRARDDNYVVNHFLKRHIEYLVDPAEIWARAYSQAVATAKGGKYLKELAKHLTMLAGDGLGQWTESEFKKLLPAIKTLLKVWGHK